MLHQRRRIVWKKNVTRETTLLERYLRMVGYAGGVGSSAQLRSKNILAVSRGGVVEQYFDDRELQRAAGVAKLEFQRGTSPRLFSIFGQKLQKIDTMTRSLIQATSTNRHISPNRILALLGRFVTGYGFGRGVVNYVHFTEQSASTELKTALASIPGLTDVDTAFRELTAPTKIVPLLRHYFRPSKAVTKRQQGLIRAHPELRRVEPLATYLQWLSYYHEVGERVTSRCFTEFQKLLKELATSLGLSARELNVYTLPELHSALRGSFSLPAREIRARQKYYVLRMIAGKLQLYTGKEARAIERRELPRTRTARVDVLRGVVACPGRRLRGIVRVIRKQSDMAKMRHGDILVSPMTTPRLMAAVRLAGAIVTDEGGVTSHAAIVSREFRIPCIIATKIASQIFRDGDRVEVDTNAGTVRRV